jgi:long-chain fatty acid transport protein
MDKFEDLKLTQPQELAFGVGVKPMDNLKVGMDIRWINWKNAKGYKEFQWKDQWVIGLGGEFKPMQKLALRAGYNYGKSPIRGGAKNPMK